MRLSKIRLNGFKSFVDATTIHFPSNRVGVVGPNGCGKSNIIDAVRWVMGEISAKNLRGGAMTDVIFNGSGTRKPADQASVELVFGEAALEQFPDQPEISVKREIGRNAQSNYYLNGVKCRRKDIMDLFLGTGLGPRSYAIIEQGMISRMIEAKPEELRIFLEEAAGIAKYKERRKETEQKMQQTRDNLARLNEVRNELQKQLDKLQKQAKEAERFQQLKNTEQLLRAQLLALRWLAQDTVVQEKQQFIEQHANQLQQDLLTLNELATTHHQQRDARTHAQQQLEEVQARHYRIEREITRIQQAIEHGNERHEQLQWDIEQLETSIEENRTQLNSDQEQAETLSWQLEETEGQLAGLQEAEMQAEDHWRESEAQWQSWQQQWDAFNERAQAPTRRAEVERTQLQNLEQRLEQTQHRLHRLEEEAQKMDTDAVQSALSTLEEELGGITEQLQSAEQVLSDYQTQVTDLREDTQHLSARLHESNTQVHRLTGLLSSLEALQNAALGKSNSDLAAWLHVQNLTDAPRLANTLQVDNGWEKAVEFVLGERLQALCVEALDGLQSALTTPPQGQLALLDMSSEVAELSMHSALPLTPLFHKVKSPPQLSGLLSGIWAAADLAEAHRHRAQLQAHESIVTPQGVWLGTNWLYSQQSMDEQAGVLAREKEINAVARQLEQLDNAVAKQTQELEQKRGQLRDAEGQRDEAQRQVNEIQQQLSQVRSQQGGRQARLESLQAQALRVKEERHELTEQLTEDGENMEVTRHNLHEALSAMDQLADEREALNQQRGQLQEAVLQARQQYQQIKDQRHASDVQMQTLKTDQGRVAQAIERLTARIEQLNEQLHELQDNLRRQVDPLGTLTGELDDYQQQRAEVEELLLQARQTVTSLDEQLSQYEDERGKLESVTAELRNQLDQARMETQASEVRRQTIEEQLAQVRLPLPEEQRGDSEETTYTPSPVALLAELPEHADEESWQAQIDAVERKLERIGSVNMAALAEFEEQDERKQYLDEQATDLDTALEMLTNAIKTIDRETRNRFKNTLDTVNTNMQAMFPRLFGGGEAHLELVGDDLLKAGVAIMARPPGKRNSTIHLLSGGEKALTAMSLVFGIFELNPAPFCMLDEVDAPLDDTNVGRFCALVSAMSERVQFIFITHNKITMEIADQLVGVTQKELGVSRPVAVDVAEAVDMVA